nr:reverse transcriptase domain-containing protein [Tanacetum cinerariifolium]
MIKSSNRETPFLLTYGTEVVIPVEIGMPTLRTTEVDKIKNNEALGINLDILEEKESGKQSKNDEFPLPKDFPTASEERFPLLRKRDATAEEVCTVNEDKVAVTTEDMQKRKNDVKAITTLFLALPDEHQLRFNKYKTAQELWAAILKTFGGNEATRKTKKNLLKQQYGNFKAEGKETLELFGGVTDWHLEPRFIETQGADEELSDGGSPRVIVYRYDGLPMRPVALSLPDYVPGPEEPQTPPIPQDEDEREPIFIQPHDPNYVSEPMYPKYIPLEDEHVLSAEEQPLPPIDSPTAEDDDDGDSSGDDADDEDEDEDEEDEEEEITVRLQAAISFPLEAEVERLLPMPTPPPSPLTSLSPPSAGERLARDDIPETEMPPRKRLCLSTLGSTYKIGESSTARPTGGRGIHYGFVSTLEAEARRQGIREVGYGIRDTWIDPAKAVPEIAPMTLGDVNTMVTELAELHEHDTQDFYALLEDAQDSRTHISHRVTIDSQRMQQAEIAELRETGRRRQAQMVETLRVMGDMRQEMGDMQAELLALREQPRRARQLGEDARVPNHPDVPRDADSHI